MLRFPKTILARCAVLALTSVGALSAPAAEAALPVSGWAVPGLAAFDSDMQQFMSLHGLAAGVLAVSRNGTIVYQRGFGYLRPGPPDPVTLPENTPMRIASCEKPITSAAIRQLVTAGAIRWTDAVFNLGQGGGGILQLTPFGGLGDNRLKNVSVQHCFDHRGGWDRATAPHGDPQFHSIDIATTMGVPHPAGRDNTIRYMLGQPLQFTPGTNGCLDHGNPTYCYSNFGYMVLGRVIETVTGTSYINYIRQNVLTPDRWVPATEIFTGRTFAADQSLREPLYVSSSTCPNVYAPDGSKVSCPYGSWNHESFIGHGNLVVSAMPLLVYMDLYEVDVGGTAGTPLDGGTGRRGIHNGALDGTSTTMWQRGDGTNIVVLFNAWPSGKDVAFEMAQVISNRIDAGGFSWPTRAVDGTWVDFNASNSLEVGGFDLPYKTMPTTLASIADGTKLRLKPGTTNWTGTISKKVRLDAPLGTASIGR